MGIACRLRTLLHQFIQIGRKDGPNCMKSIVATQPLSLQAGERLGNDFLPKSQLVLHDDVNDCVELGVRQGNLLAVMVGRDRLDALAFVGLQPVSGVPLCIGIVRVHVVIQSVLNPVRLDVSR